MNFTDARWNKTISDKLRTLIKESKKTHREIANDLNMCESAISDMLYGKRLTLCNVVDMACYFGVSVDWLVGLKNGNHKRDA